MSSRLMVIGFPYQTDFPASRIIFVDYNDPGLNPVWYTTYSEVAAMSLLQEMKRHTTTRDRYGLGATPVIADLEHQIRTACAECGIQKELSAYDNFHANWQKDIEGMIREGNRDSELMFVHPEEFVTGPGRSVILFDFQGRCVRIVQPEIRQGKMSGKGRSMFTVYSASMLRFVASVAAQHDVPGLRVQDFLLVNLGTIIQGLKRSGYGLPDFHSHDTPTIMALNNLVGKDLTLEFPRFVPPV